MSTYITLQCQSCNQVVYQKLVGGASIVDSISLHTCSQESIPEPPTEPGLYDLTIRIRVEKGKNNLVVNMVDEWITVQDIKGQWSGPIKEPE